MPGKFSETFQLRLLPELKDSFDRVCDEKGISRVVAANRLIKWFADQDGLFQSIILDQLPDDSVPDVARVILKRLARTRHSSGRRKPEIKLLS